LIFVITTPFEETPFQKKRRFDSLRKPQDSKRDNEPKRQKHTTDKREHCFERAEYHCPVFLSRYLARGRFAVFSVRIIPTETLDVHIRNRTSVV
jgi:hypothetical protein